MWDDLCDIAIPIIFVVASILLMAFIIGAILLGIRQVDHRFTVANCPKRAQAYNRETKFVEYNFWSYECLVKAKDGTYVNVNKMVNNIQN